MDKRSFSGLQIDDDAGRKSKTIRRMGGMEKASVRSGGQLVLSEGRVIGSGRFRFDSLAI